MSRLGIGLLLEGFSDAAHPRDWHGRFRAGDMVRLKIKAADGMDVVGRIQRFTEDGKKAVIAPVRGGAHVEAGPGDIAFHSPKSAVSAADRYAAAEQRAHEAASSGVRIPSGVNDPNLARRRAAREAQPKPAEFKAGDSVHVASELRYIGRGKLTGQEKDTGHWLVTLDDGRRGRAAKDQVFRTRKAAQEHARTPQSGGWSDVAKLNIRPGTKAAKLNEGEHGVGVLLEAFAPAAPPETPAQSMAIGARQTAAAGVEARAWAASKHPRAAGGKFGYTTGGKRARSSSSSHRVLTVGTAGALVRSIQRQLGLPADGTYGPNTKAAVVRFQQQHHLLVDGIVGAQTLAALRGRTGVAPGPIPTKAARIARPRQPTVKAPVRLAGGIVV